MCIVSETKRKTNFSFKTFNENIRFRTRVRETTVLYSRNNITLKRVPTDFTHIVHTFLATTAIKWWQFSTNVCRVLLTTLTYDDERIVFSFNNKKSCAFEQFRHALPVFTVNILFALNTREFFRSRGSFFAAEIQQEERERLQFIFVARRELRRVRSRRERQSVCIKYDIISMCDS